MVSSQELINEKMEELKIEEIKAEGEEDFDAFGISNADLKDELFEMLQVCTYLLLSYLL